MNAFMAFVHHVETTLKFLSWRKGAAIDAEDVRRVRKLVHLELLGVVFILLFAALMARGIGFLG